MENHAMQELDLEEVRIRAYLFWEERGRPEGSADEDWFRAEQSVYDHRARREPPQAVQARREGRRGAGSLLRLLSVIPQMWYSRSPRRGDSAAVSF